MYTIRCVCVLGILGLLVNAAGAGEPVAPSGAAMTEAATRFLGLLSPQQKARAMFSFDDRERLNWHYIPLEDKKIGKATRNGLPLEAMGAKQKAAAMELLRAGTSAAGYTKATNIIEFENMLALHEKGSSWTRNPGWYFVSVFGDPSKSGRWGWRIEGHHLALNFVIDQGKVISASPAFFGTNPAMVKDGPKKGYRNLAEAEDLARDLFASFDDAQMKAAHQARHFPQIEGRNAVLKLEKPVGLAVSKMAEKQQHTLMKLIQSYLDRLPADVAKTELDEIKQAGIDKVFFGYSGGSAIGQPHTYRIQGPSFLIDYNCEQTDSLNNPGNHIHSVYRNLHRDFALGIVNRPGKGQVK